MLAEVLRGGSPIAFLRAIRQLQLLAFSTSSPAAVMPLSEETAQREFGVRQRVAQVTVPLGATFNMDATAVYQSIAAVFLVQAAGMDLGPQEVAILAVGAVISSIGSPSTPGAAIIILSMTMVSIGVPVALILLVIGVDRVLDMTRTAVNVAGDLTACILMDKWVSRRSIPADATDVEPTMVAEPAADSPNPAK